jgi:hypothetical protein
MARRINKGLSPVLLVGILLLLAVAVVGGVLVMNQGSSGFTGLPVLDIDDYMENGNSLRGNTYQLEGEVSNQISWSARRGRLYSFEVETEMGQEILPVLVPAEFNHVNLQKGLLFQMKVAVEEDGVLVAKEVKKV